MNNELMHYGVKGMKWGVRKEDYKSMSRAERKATKKNYYRYNPTGRIKKATDIGAVIGGTGAGDTGMVIGAIAGGLTGGLSGIPTGIAIGGGLGTFIGLRAGANIGRRYMCNKLDAERIKVSEISQDYVDAGRDIVEPIKNTKFKIEK